MNALALICINLDLTENCNIHIAHQREKAGENHLALLMKTGCPRSGKMKILMKNFCIRTDFQVDLAKYMLVVVNNHMVNNYMTETINRYSTYNKSSELLATE